MEKKQILQKEKGVKDAVACPKGLFIAKISRKNVPIVTFYSPFADDVSARQTAYWTLHLILFALKMRKGKERAWALEPS